MPNQINGLPAHVLLVHLVVVLIPVASVAVLVSAWWPAARRRLGAATPILAILSLIVVPITTHAGNWLKNRLPSTPDIERHASLGNGMLKWVIGLAIVGIAVYAVGLVSDRQARAAVGADQRVPVTAGAPDPAGEPASATSAQPGRRPAGSMFVAGLVIAVLATAVSVGTGVQIYRVGDSGAHAVWRGIPRS